IDPQYAGSTTGAVADVLAQWMKGRREVPSLHLLKDYWQSDAWQQAIVVSIRTFRAEHGTADKLLFSFHGIPQSYQKKGDRYGERCLHSAQQDRKSTRLNSSHVKISYAVFCLK